MKITFLLLLAIFIPSRMPVLASPDQILILPLCFHIVTDLSMSKNGRETTTWVDRKNIVDEILPEINRIWRPAGIQFESVCVNNTPALDPPDKKRLLKDIADAHRDADGRANPNRIKKLKKLIDFSRNRGDSINIHLIPYLGEKSQGHAQRGKKRIFVGQWTDKALDQGEPPEKFQLVEPLPFKKGSLARTLAHELGHVLGLIHPDKKHQRQFGLLMGGKRAGYGLTAEEISTARKEARIIVNQ